MTLTSNFCTSGARASEKSLPPIFPTYNHEQNRVSRRSRNTKTNDKRQTKNRKLINNGNDTTLGIPLWIFLKAQRNFLSATKIIIARTTTQEDSGSGQTVNNWKMARGPYHSQSQALESLIATNNIIADSINGQSEKIMVLIEQACCRNISDLHTFVMEWKTMNREESNL